MQKLKITILVAGTLLAVILLFLINTRSTRVVKSIDIEQLDARYTIPARHYSYWVGPITDGYMREGWTKAEEVRYERWTITAFDGFEIVIDDVDPMSRPEIRENDRYTGWWK